MAKRVSSYSFKNAYIDFDDETITEVTKEEELTYSLRKVFEEFKGRAVSFSVREETIPTPLEDSGEKDEDE